MGAFGRETTWALGRTRRWLVHPAAEELAAELHDVFTVLASDYRFFSRYDRTFEDETEAKQALLVAMADALLLRGQMRLPGST